MIQEVLCTRAGFIPWGPHNLAWLSPAGAHCTPNFAAQLLLQGDGGDADLLEGVTKQGSSPPARAEPGFVV